MIMHACQDLENYNQHDEDSSFASEKLLKIELTYLQSMTIVIITWRWHHKIWHDDHDFDKHWLNWFNKEGTFCWPQRQTMFSYFILWRKHCFAKGGNGPDTPLMVTAVYDRAWSRPSRPWRFQAPCLVTTLQTMDICVRCIQKSTIKAAMTWSSVAYMVLVLFLRIFCKVFFKFFTLFLFFASYCIDQLVRSLSNIIIIILVTCGYIPGVRKIMKATGAGRREFSFRL